MKPTRSSILGLALAAGCALMLSGCGLQVGQSAPDGQRPGANSSASTAAKAARAYAEIPSVPADWEPDASRKVIYLTFDDGPGVATPEVLDILKQNGAKATFFQIGKMIRTREDIAARVTAEGHLVGNHTWDHVDLTQLSESAVRKQLKMTQKHIGRAQGLCMRPPFGAINDQVRNISVSMGMTPVLWNIDTNDWHDASEAAIQAQIESATSGSVILMHDGGGDRTNTVRALRDALPKLKAKGYRFESVPVCNVATQ